jgi:crotonobetainyl-CoA:carnitine CoA-transferase CaiB-like acyl-CoA transferase
MELPLSGVRVVDTTDGRGAMCGRFLADLGADVVLVEPPGGSSSRRAEPAVHGTGLGFAVRCANKRSVQLDLASDAGRARFLDLVTGADIWVDGHRPGVLESCELEPAAVQARFPELVVAMITDFGLSGPRHAWCATDWVLFALAGQLSRSGVPGRPPFMLPGDLADETTAVQACWGVVVAYWNRLETGVGDVIDLSRHEAATQVVDPPFGSIGTAAAQSGAVVPRGRERSVLYPYFPCADGHVRIVLLAARQWHGMRAWLGEPQEFADEKYDRAWERFKVARRLYPLIAARFRDQPRMDLVAEGQRRGVPIAPVLTPREVMAAEHFAVRGLFVELPVGGAKVGRAPVGHVLVDGERMGIRTSAPLVGEHDDSAGWDDTGGRPSAPTPTSDRPRRPLEGLRVLDLGVIVMGGEAGRLLADQGADVVKVESARFPDGARMAGMTASFAAGHRNKRSLGINLRDPEGHALFVQLVERSDVVLSNFKPGTLESLGLGPERLREINPGVVVVTSSAMGEWGPWRDWMGYGPLVRCVSGLSHLWCDTGVEDGFGDTTTIYPDHFVARIVDIAVIAALVRRRRTGLGAHIESSQAESILVALGPQMLQESLSAGSAHPSLHGEVDAPWGVYPCAGDDEWCVVTVRDDGDWEALERIIARVDGVGADRQLSRAERIAHRATIDEAVTRWTSARTAPEVEEVLQSAGVPVAMMKRVPDLATDPQLTARGFFRSMRQPGISGEVIVENGPCVARRLPDPDLRPAPYYGQHTRDLCRELLGLGDAEIDDLVARGVLDELSERDAQALQQPPS